MAEHESGIEVALLGPVQVRGAPEPFRRSAALGLVVYLASHRRAVAQGEWVHALWLDRAVTPTTVHSTASDARRALGRASDGTLHLPRGRLLRLGDGVTTDVERFAALVSTRHLPSLLDALRLVRGPLFAGPGQADWAVLDGTQAALEAMVVETGLRAATSSLAAGRADEAIGAVRRALLVSPYDERLYRALLEATAAQGSRVGLRSTMVQLLTLAADVPRPERDPRWPGFGTAQLSLLHPQTTALYDSLVSGLPATRASPSRL
jgi:DNA-binding SARP family transcriptional activator